MLRKIKSTNTIKALAVIAILVTSLLAIQVEGKENQQGEENMQQGPSGLISPQGSQMMMDNQSLAVCGQQCLLWIDQVVYTRLVLIAFQANATEDFDASYTRLLRNAELLGNASQPILGQEGSQNLTTLLKIHDQIYVQILNQTRLNDTEALNNSLTMWYENAAQIADLYNDTMDRALLGGNQNMQGGDQTQRRFVNMTILADLNEYLDATLLEVNEYMQGNYSSSITHFDHAKSVIHNLLFKICMTIMTIPPEMATTTITKTRTTTKTTTKTITKTLTKTTTKTKTEGRTNTTTTTTGNTTTVTTTTNTTTTTTTNTTTTMTNTTTTTTNTTTTGANVTTTIMVSIVNGAGNDTSSPGYSPDSITVVVGVNNTVRWANDDGVDHTVTSTDVPSGASSFDSGNMDPGDTFTLTFTVPGTYHYHCSLHSWMNGTIVVEGP